MLLYAVHNIIFQHPVALVNDLICRGGAGDANSCRARRLCVCYLVTIYLQMLLVRYVSAL
jgi:hypothetical protein